MENTHPRVGGNKTTAKQSNFGGNDRTRTLIRDRPILLGWHREAIVAKFALSLTRLSSLSKMKPFFTYLTREDLNGFDKYKVTERSMQVSESNY